MLGRTPAEQPDSFATAHDKERSAIHAARSRVGMDAATTMGELVGLALSGGGIRSATFSLGVLQAIAKHSKLTSFDYLSTVSGGGYIGSWLSAWINRDGLSAVETALKPRPAEHGRPPEADAVNWLRKYSNYLAPRLGLLSADSLTLIATWTRNVLLNLIIFVSMLAVLCLVPRVLVYPATAAIARYSDELGYAAAWLGFFIFPLAISFNLARMAATDSLGRVNWATTTTGVFATVIAPGVVATILASLSIFSPSSTVTSHVGGLALGTAVLLLLAGIIQIPRAIYKREFKWSTVSEAFVFALAYAVALIVAFLILMEAVAMLRGKGSNDVERAAIVLTFGPPALLATFGVSGSIIVGLVGRVYYERSREWWGRLTAWLAIIAVAWFAWFGLAFYALPVTEWMDANSAGWFKSLGGIGWLGSLLTTLLVPKPATTKTLAARLGSRALDIAATVVVIGFLIIVAALTAYTLRSVAVDSPAQPAKVSSPSDFNLTISKGGQVTQTKLALTENAAPKLPAFIEASFEDQEYVNCFRFSLADHLCKPNDDQRSLGCLTKDFGPEKLDLTGTALILCFAVFLIFGFRVDVNKFSLHNLYKNRLVRCYLGASRCNKRVAQPFTGFDELDDLPLTRLRAEAETGEVQRPLHIVNVAVNITQGSNLAWQERKAASFTFSPWHCGFSFGPGTGDAVPVATATPSAIVGGPASIPGDATSRRRAAEAYRDSKHYASEQDEANKRFSLGMAMATSGAAVSPNMGNASSPPLAFMLTLFNVRLGRWSPNPAQSYWRRSSPWFGLRLLLYELFGFTNENSDFVYLSDGGHFDNTAIYELVRRRCMTIVAVDAGADFKRAFADMANLVRKCRVDFGVEVNIGLDKFGTERAQEANSKGYALGTIDYGPLRDLAGNEVSGKRRIGRLIVIKPTLIGLQNLGVDIFSYSKGEELFPQQSTADQFFDESQFESYRALGFCIADQCLGDGNCRLPTALRGQVVSSYGEQP